MFVRRRGKGARAGAAGRPGRARGLPLCRPAVSTSAVPPVPPTSPPAPRQPLRSPSLTPRTPPPHFHPSSHFHKLPGGLAAGVPLPVGMACEAVLGCVLNLVVLYSMGARAGVWQGGHWQAYRSGGGRAAAAQHGW